MPVYILGKTGVLEVVTLEWGFPRDGRARTIFNPRMETAPEQLRFGRRSMWAEAITEDCCLVSVQTFYERQTNEKVDSERPGRSVRLQRLFRLPGARTFPPVAGREGECFSIATTKPSVNVAPVHNRMSLVREAGESGVWLGSDFASLSNRNAIHLSAVADELKSQRRREYA